MIAVHCPGCGETMRERGVHVTPGVEIHPSQPAKPNVELASLGKPPTGIEFSCPSKTCGFAMLVQGPEAMAATIATSEYATRMRRAYQRAARNQAETS